MYDLILESSSKYIIGFFHCSSPLYQFRFNKDMPIEILDFFIARGLFQECVHGDGELVEIL